MAENIKLVVYPAKDLESAKSFFGAFLGAEPYADTPYYVGYKVGELEVGLDPNGDEVIAYKEVQDIQSALKTLTDAGATVHQATKDVGGGMLITTVRDINGNVLGLRQLAS